MKVELEAAQDIWLQVNIPEKVTIDEFLARVEQLEHVIARNKKSSSSAPHLPSFDKPQASSQESGDVQGRLNHLEHSTQRIIELLDNLQQ